MPIDRESSCVRLSRYTNGENPSLGRQWDHDFYASPIYKAAKFMLSNTPHIQGIENAVLVHSWSIFILHRRKTKKDMTATARGCCLSCPNSTVLVLTGYAVDIGSFPACYTANRQRVRRLNYVRNIEDCSVVVFCSVLRL